jgi:hypothetical protein
MPAPAEERREAARNRLLDCPHRELSPLEYYYSLLASFRGMGVGDQTGVTDSDTGEHVVPGVQAVCSPSPQPVEEPNRTEATDAQVGTA